MGEEQVTEVIRLLDTQAAEDAARQLIEAIGSGAPLPANGADLLCALEGREGAPWSVRNCLAPGRLDPFEIADAYLAAALFCEEPDDGIHAEAPEEPWSEEDRHHALRQVWGFLRLLDRTTLDALAQHGDQHAIGHDLWLTRQGHGAGFWDGGWPAIGDALTEVCKRMGEDYETENALLDIFAPDLAPSEGMSPVEARARLAELQRGHTARCLAPEDIDRAVALYNEAAQEAARLGVPGSAEAVVDGGAVAYSYAFAASASRVRVTAQGVEVERGQARRGGRADEMDRQELRIVRCPEGATARNCGIESPTIRKYRGQLRW